MSGADGHKLHDGKTSDGSAVTFMATHVLPTAYQINTTLTTAGGWGACQLYKDMNKVGGTEFTPCLTLVVCVCLTNFFKFFTDFSYCGKIFEHN